ncbi:MAG TPA: lysozyme [Solirubrobacteraceae bacterium]|jgi:lysozyme
MHISDRGVRLIAGFEGFSSAPYWDPYGRVWTRGFGETEGITSGSPHISYDEGLARLRSLVEARYEWALRALDVPSLNQNQWDALCSFAWNLGAGIFAGALRDALVRHDWRGAAGIMLQYDHAGGVRLEGLTRRRRAEVDLFLTPVTPTNPLDVLTEAERDAVDSYDRYVKHPVLHRHGLAVTRAQLVVFRKLIWLAAERGRDGAGRRVERGWGVHSRLARWHLLKARTR